MDIVYSVHVYMYRYGNCMISIFSDKKFFFFIFIDTPKIMPKQEKSS